MPDDQGPFEASSLVLVPNDQEKSSLQGLNREEGRKKLKVGKGIKSSFFLANTSNCASGNYASGVVQSSAMRYPSSSVNACISPVHSSDSLPTKEGCSQCTGALDSVDAITEPERNYVCNNYETCLGLAAALDWNSFSCKNCGGTVDEKLLWRAHQVVRKNRSLSMLCSLPEIGKSGK